MATYTSTANRGYTLQLVTTPIAHNQTDINNNQTRMSYVLYIHATHTYMQDVRSKANVTINGVNLLTETEFRTTFTGPNTSVSITTFTTTIPHNADGTKTVSVSAWFETINKYSYTPSARMTLSGSEKLVTIPRTSIVSLSNSSRNLAQSVIISTNRASTSFTHTLSYKIGTLEGTIATGVGASYTWTIPNALGSAIPKSTSGVVTITCKTYNSNNALIGSSSTALTINVPNTTTYRPSASITSVTEGATMPSGITLFVRNRSRLRFKSSGSAKHGATVAQYRITYDSSHYYGADVTMGGTVQNTGDRQVILRVTDSRGYYTETNAWVAIEDYFSPTITTLRANRSPDDESTDLSAHVDFKIAPINNQNTKRYLLRYRQTGGSWVTVINSTNFYARQYTHSLSDVLNSDYSYEVNLQVSDSFTTVQVTEGISTGFTLLNFNASGKGVAIGKVSESDTFEVAMPMTIDGHTAWHAGNDAPLFYEADNSISSTENASSWKNGIRAMRVGVTGLGYPRHGILESVKYGTYVSQILAGTDREIFHRTTASATGNFYAWTTFWTSYNSNTMTGYGTNPNGSYVQFSDGTMICYFIVPCSYNTPIRLRGVWTFPASFIANPTALPTKAYSGSTVRLINTSAHVAATTTTNTTIDLVQVVNASGSAMVDTWASGDVYGASCIALGRWK